MRRRCAPSRLVVIVVLINFRALQSADPGTRAPDALIPMRTHMRCVAKTCLQDTRTHAESRGLTCAASTPTPVWWRPSVRQSFVHRIPISVSTFRPPGSTFRPPGSTFRPLDPHFDLLDPHFDLLDAHFDLADGKRCKDCLACDPMAHETCLTSVHTVKRLSD